MVSASKVRAQITRGASSSGSQRVESSVCRAAAVVFPDLDADDFRRFDKQSTPNMMLLVRFEIFCDTEGHTRLERSREGSVSIKEIQGIESSLSFVVVHTCLMELLTRNELQVVLAHELGSLKCDRCVWLTFANIITLEIILYLVSLLHFTSPVWSFACAGGE
ncbi:hypothetical protein SAY87_007234 [Trapa incisa]|uniref:Peptidase M48 domain-containing protein n=1 Tax=Trapa incisa TaxID=236973 RepID=A0AAN7K0W0_9MYRT|nr:hypothetical protein SAY87_007234 [Trapa incisa]